MARSTTYATLVVPKDHVHYPVQAVFDTPMAAYCLAYLPCVARQRTEVVPRLLFHFTLGQQLTSALNLGDAAQPRPTVAVVQPVDLFRRHHATGQATVIFLTRLMHCHPAPGQATLLLVKQQRHVLMQRPLIAFEPQDVFPALSHDLLRMAR